MDWLEAAVAWTPEAELRQRLNWLQPWIEPLMRYGPKEPPLPTTMTRSAPARSVSLGYQQVVSPELPVRLRRGETHSARAACCVVEIRSLQWKWSAAAPTKGLSLSSSTYDGAGVMVWRGKRTVYWDGIGWDSIRVSSGERTAMGGDGSGYGDWCSCLSPTRDGTKRGGSAVPSLRGKAD